MGSRASDRSGSSPCQVYRLLRTPWLNLNRHLPVPVLLSQHCQLSRICVASALLCFAVTRWLSSTLRWILSLYPLPIFNPTQPICPSPTIIIMGGFYMQYLESKSSSSHEFMPTIPLPGLCFSTVLCCTFHRSGIGRCVKKIADVAGVSILRVISHPAHAVDRNEFLRFLRSRVDLLLDRDCASPT